MTVSTTINRKEYNGNGPRPPSHPLPFPADADLVVLLVDANGAATTGFSIPHTPSAGRNRDSGQVTVRLAHQLHARRGTQLITTVTRR